jgi:hypothetical protein
VKRRSKKKLERAHAIQRASERYGVNLSDTDIRRIIKLIQNGESTPVSRRSLRKVTHDVTLDGQLYRAVCDKQRKEIVTFLPPPKGRSLDEGNDQ